MRKFLLVVALIRVLFTFELTSYADCESNPHYLDGQYTGCETALDKQSRKYSVPEMSERECLLFCNWHDISESSENPLRELQTEFQKDAKKLFKDHKAEEGPFFVDQKLKPIKDASVVALNLDLAVKLGLIAEKDLKDSKKLALLEEQILQNFAYVAEDESGGSVSKLPADPTRKPKIGMNTYYLGGSSLSKDDARGDGRAVLLRYVKVLDSKGNRSYVYIGIKGSGRSPLAPHGDIWEGHVDGVQDIDESAQSIVKSYALRPHQGEDFVSQEDLAIIRLPKQEDGRVNSLTVRIIPGIRLGAFEWLSHPDHSNRPYQDLALTRLFEMGVKQELGLSKDHKLTPAKLQQFLRKASRRLGSMAALYEDEGIFHGSPTYDNITMGGHPLDTGALRGTILHKDEKILISSLGKVKVEALDYQKMLVKISRNFISKSSHFKSTKINIKSIEKILTSEYNKGLRERRLVRLGFNDDEAKITESECASEASDLFKEIGHIAKSDFDLRALFSQSLSALSKGDEAQRALLLRAFVGTEPKAPQDKIKVTLAQARPLIFEKPYFSRLKSLVDCMDQKLELDDEKKKSAHDTRVKRAQSIVKNYSFDPTVYQNEFYSFLQDLKTTSKPGYSQFPKIQELSQKLTDHPSCRVSLEDKVQCDVNHLENFFKQLSQLGEPITQELFDELEKWHEEQKLGRIPKDFDPHFQKIKKSFSPSEELSKAIRAGNLDRVKTLIKAKVDLDTPNSEGWTPLNLAATKGKLEITEALIEAKADINKPNKDGWLPLDLAIHYKHPAVVKALVKAKAQIHRPNLHGQTPLSQAAATGDLEILGAIIGGGARVDQPGKDARTPLHEAAQRGHLEVVKALVRLRPNLDSRDSHEFTPLAMAVYYGKVDTAKYLIKKKASLLLFIQGRSLLEIAKGAKDQTPEMLEVVENAMKDSLFRSIEKGDAKAVEFHLKAKTPLSQKDNHDNTPLHLAAKFGHKEVVKMLLEAKADYSLTNKDDKSPIDLAQDPEIIRLLNEAQKKEQHKK